MYFEKVLIIMNDSSVHSTDNNPLASGAVVLLTQISFLLVIKSLM